MADKQEYGKFCYVEPNDFLEEQLFGENNTSFNLTHPYEDYCISVDLIVSKPDRFNIVTNENKTHEFGTNSLKGEKISFINGKDNFLTDLPGTLIYRDIMNNDIDGGRESLGINNINITYDSYYFPVVTINFTDVRGNALMMTEEENYRRGAMGNENTVESFFTSLFSFPYPDFTLRVKGFYGKKVEYNLVVSEFKSSFNNETGNFECIVKFIGRMYGVYTDIPMIYLLTAPYCKYGGRDGKTIWQGNNFELEDGTPMPTLIELNDRIINANNELKQNINLSSIKEHKEIENNNNLLLKIKDLFLKLKKDFLDFTSDKDDNIFSTNGGELMIIKCDYGKCEYLFEIPYITLYTDIVNLCQEIDNYNESTKGEKIEYPFPYNEDNKSFGNLDNFKVYIKYEHKSYVCRDITNTYKYNFEDKYGTQLDGFLKIDKTDNASVYSELRNKSAITDYIDNPDAFMVENNREYFLICKDFEKKIENILEENNKKLETINNTLDDVINTTLIELIGFVPSIKNMFNILMAHLQTFVEIYSNFTNNINGVNQRYIEEYGLTLEQTDIKANVEKNIPLSAFPYVKNKSDNTYCYPVSPIVKKTMEETVLIDSIFEGVYNVSKIIEDTEVKKVENLNIIPTCLTDLYGYIKPYKISENSTKGGLDWLYLHFGLRFIQKYFFESSKLDYEVFGKCEAYNFWNENKNSEKLYKYLSAAYYINGMNLVNFLINENFNLLKTGTNKNIYETKDIKKILIRENDLLYIPYEKQNNFNTTKENVFYFPAVIGRSENAWEQFVNDCNEDADGIYSFNCLNGKKSRPYHFIRFVDEDRLDSISTAMDNFDHSEYCNDGIWNSFAKQYIESTKNIFYGDNESDKTDVFYVKDGVELIGYYNKSESLKTYKKNCNIVDLSTSYNDNFNNYKLSEILYNDVNIFLDEEITPEKLLNLKFDLHSISKALYDGKTVLTMPYTLQLFLGMVLYKLKNDFENFKEFLKYIHGSENLELSFSTTDIFDSHSKSSYLGYIINNLVRDKNNSYYLYFSYYDDTIKVSGESVMDAFKSMKENGFFENDYLGLIKQYERWLNSNSKDNMGFKYIKNKFILENKYADNETINKTLLSYFEGDSEGNINDKTLKKFLDENFVSLDKKYSFTDVYSKVIYIKGGFLGKNYIRTILNEKFEGYETLYNFFKKTSKLVLPYPMHYHYVNGNYVNRYFNFNKIQISDLASCFNAFKNQLLKLYEENKGNENEIEKNNNVGEESKLSIYRTLKNLEDKFFYKFKDSNEVDKFKIKKDNSYNYDSEFGRFYFLDTYFNDLGDEIMVNLDNLSSLISKITDGAIISNNKIQYNDMSVFSFMTQLCECANMLFLSIPVFETFKKENIGDSITKMFTPLSYNETLKDENISGASYVCFYPNQPSQYLDIPSSNYSNDGFDINDTSNYTGPKSISDLIKENDKCLIPAFGVEYGSQRQSIFKTININMDNPQTTEVAVANQFALAKHNNEEIRSMSFQGQDLYKIYSNYSYYCGVEMMGCAQIMPLMYFQLNNIPMFRGAYQIYQVEHNITPGNMTTNFKGVRINKTKMPLVKTCISLNSMKDLLLNSDISSDNKIKSFEKINIDFNFNEDCVYRDMIGNEDFNVSANILKNTEDISVSFASGQEKAFDKLNPNLRQLVYCLAKDLSEAPEELGKLTLHISSSTRENLVNGNSGSDHLIGNDGCSARRKILKGKDANGVEKYYNNLGCAVDIYVKKNGVIDKCQSTIYLFKIILTKYYDYIRQLIWEALPSSQAVISSNKISNVIHLASYGKRGDNGTDKTEVFVSSEDYNYKGSSCGCDNLPINYLEIVKDVINEGKAEHISFTNFVDNNKPSVNFIEELISLQA